MPRLSIFSCLSRLLFLWLLLCPSLIFAESGSITITHPDVSASSLTATQTRLLFGMRLRQWDDLRPVKVFVLPDSHPVHDNYCKSVLHVFPHQLRTVWNRQVFSGTGQAPMELRSEEEMLEHVATTPGSIGYISREKADKSKVRIIEVRGVM